MSISVITPTEERPSYLLLLYQLLLQQKKTDWEWLIYDSSLRPCKELLECCDARIHYIHDLESKTVGEKRNLLIQQARSELIVHFDDDDYYAPNYLSLVEGVLEEVDFFHIHSWFAYHRASKQYFYWDSQEKTKSRLAINPLLGARIREIDFGEELAKSMIEDGYGFTFAYKKKLVLAHPFPDLDLSEDTAFFKQIKKSRAKVRALSDQEGVTLKVIHDCNLSCIFPQFMIPRFLVKSMLPHLVAHENRYLSRE